jgi:hypothetical protein
MAHLGALYCGDDFVSQLASSRNQRAKGRLRFVSCCGLCAGTRVGRHYDLAIGVPSRIRVQVNSPTIRNVPCMTAFKPATLSCLRSRLQSPELKARKLDGLFDLRSGKSVWGMLIGFDQARRSPRSMAFRQFASRWVTGKCVQVGTCFRSEHIDEHNDAFRNARLD